MKKLYYIFLLLIAFGSCKDNADYPFTGKDAVLFPVAGGKLLLDKDFGQYRLFFLPVRGLIRIPCGCG